MSKEKKTVELNAEDLGKVSGGIPNRSFNGYKNFLNKRFFSCPNCGKTFSFDAYEKNENACPFCNPKDQSYMM